MSGEHRGLRVRDPKGPLATGFLGFKWFPIDPKYRVTGKFIKDAEPRSLKVLNTFGDIDEYKTEGVVEFTLLGKTIDTMMAGRLGPSVLGSVALGHTWGPHPERGVYRSRDGGKSWTKVLFISPRTGVVDLAMDPKNPRVLYAVVQSDEGGGGSIDSPLSKRGGIFRSEDGGESWTRQGALNPRDRKSTRLNSSHRT